MSNRLTVAGAVAALCLSVGLSGAETPAVAAEAPPLPPGPGRWEPMPSPPPGGPADMEERQLEWMARALDLSAEQRAAFGKILERQGAQRETLRGQLKDGGRKLREALEAVKPDPSTVGTLMIGQRTLMQKLGSSRERARQELRALLTTEQRAAFDALPKPGPRERMRGRMLPMGPPPPMPPEPPRPDEERP